MLARSSLGLLAQAEGLSANELAERLELDTPAALRAWTGRPLELGLVSQSGRTKGTRYFVPPALLQGAGLDLRTTLARVQPHRLRTLIFEDLERFPGSSMPEIHHRIAPELPLRTLNRAVYELVAEGKLARFGERRWARYSIAGSLSEKDRDGV